MLECKEANSDEDIVSKSFVENTIEFQQTSILIKNHLVDLWFNGYFVRSMVINVNPKEYLFHRISTCVALYGSLRTRVYNYHLKAITKH